MQRNAFENDSDSTVRRHCEEIVLCLIVYGELNEAAARQLLDESKHCSPEVLVTDEDRAVLLQELPYFLAMELLHGRTNRHWYNDPALWPPPQEYSDTNWPYKRNME